MPLFVQSDVVIFANRYYVSVILILHWYVFMQAYTRHPVQAHPSSLLLISNFKEPRNQLIWIVLCHRNVRFMKSHICSNSSGIHQNKQISPAMKCSHNCNKKRQKNCHIRDLRFPYISGKVVHLLRLCLLRLVFHVGYTRRNRLPLFFPGLQIVE